jgi:hypothetical protein
MPSIHIFRTSKDTGTLLLSGFSFSARETCWWNADWVIAARCYQGYPYYMGKKYDGTAGNGLPHGTTGTQNYREAVHFGQGVKWNNGKNSNDGVFLHRGTDPGWSDGCIVTRSDLVYQIWAETRMFRANTTSGADNLLYRAAMNIYVIDLSADGTTAGTQGPKSITDSFMF